MKLNLKTILFIFLTGWVGSSVTQAQTVQLVPDSCTFCLFLASTGGNDWYQSGYDISPNEDTLVLGNNYIRVHSGFTSRQPFAIRQVGNKLMGVVADSLSEYLLMDFDANTTDTIHNLYSEGIFYDAVVLSKDSVLVNNGVYHHFMQLNGIGHYTQFGYIPGNWDFVWNERGLCAVNTGVWDLGGVLYNIPTDFYVISAVYAFPEFCTTDPIYNNPVFVTCDNCYAQTNGVDELISGRLELVPNPAVNEISVRLEDSFIRKLSVYDIHGIQVMEQASFSKELIIQVSELTPGLYFLSLDTDEGKVLSRFIKI